ncbi:hypothetical protein C8J57DRAFT_1504638 [Mycena rebaudengoi]|nr:hypothetical protein C8J57DRAFT_1504638 [Mycena rebaudengoi]
MNVGLLVASPWRVNGGVWTLSASASFPRPGPASLDRHLVRQRPGRLYTPPSPPHFLLTPCCMQTAGRARLSPRPTATLHIRISPQSAALAASSRPSPLLRSLSTLLPLLVRARPECKLCAQRPTLVHFSGADVRHGLILAPLRSTSAPLLSSPP